MEYFTTWRPLRFLQRLGRKILQPLHNRKLSLVNTAKLGRNLQTCAHYCSSILSWNPTVLPWKLEIFVFVHFINAYGKVAKFKSMQTLRGKTYFMTFTVPTNILSRDSHVDATILLKTKTKSFYPWKHEKTALKRYL